MNPNCIRPGDLVYDEFLGVFHLIIYVSKSPSGHHLFCESVNASSCTTLVVKLRPKRLRGANDLLENERYTLIARREA